MDTAAVYLNNCTRIPRLLMSGIKTCLVHNDVNERPAGKLTLVYGIIV